uniref:Uncharacterized protein n=1 Tax=Arundo donax TaxID=35708 RepID=A0A0A9CIJ1_ARUDO
MDPSPSPHSSISSLISHTNSDLDDSDVFFFGFPHHLSKGRNARLADDEEQVKQVCSALGSRFGPGAQRAW